MPHLGDVVNIRPSFVSADLDGPVTGLSFSTNGTALTAAAGKSFYVWHKSQGEVGGEGEVKEELVTVPATEEDLLRRLVSIVVAEEGVLQENIVERIMRKLQKGQVVKNVVVASPELLAAVRWLMVCHQPGHVEEALEVLEKQSAEIKAQPWFQILVSKILECQTNPDIKQRLTQLLGEEENAEVETSI